MQAEELKMDGKVEEGLDCGHEPKQKYLRWLQSAVDSVLYIQQGSLKFSTSASCCQRLLACCLLADRHTDLQACCE